MKVQDDFDIHHLCPLVDPFGVGRLQVFQPQLFLPAHPVLCRCKRFEPGRRPVVSLKEIHLAISLFSVAQLNERAELEHEPGSDILHDLGLNLVSNGTFQIGVEAKQECAPALLVLRFWKVFQGVKLFHNFSRVGPHTYEALLFIKPSNQGSFGVTTPGAPDSPGRLHICRGCSFHSHSPGRIPGRGVPPIG